MGDRRDVHERVLQADNPGERASAYAEWAHRDDADLIRDMGYRAPLAAAELLDLHLDSKSARILDAGCGTGLAGQELTRLGYQDLIGLDYSADMLAQAKLKDVYQDLLQRDLTKPLDIDRNRFDAVILRECNSPAISDAKPCPNASSSRKMRMLGRRN